MVVISQPTYLPWPGYFDLIDRSEFFVFLDDVQFDRRSWQQRNRIISNNDEYLMLSVPVIKKGNRNQSINEVKVVDYSFKKKHLTSIKNSYSKSKYLNTYFDELENVFNISEKSKNLAELNINLIKWLSKSLGISSKFKRSSELSTRGKRGKKLSNICKQLNKKSYLTNAGAMEYIKKDKMYFDLQNIKIFVQNYEQLKYNQQSGVFFDKASVLDLLFNEGPNSLSVIRSGRKKDTIL